MPARTGAQLLRGLKDDREIWVGDDRVTDIVSHPAFAGAAKGMAAVFDLQHEAADDCLIPDPETGEPINVSHMIPRSPDDLKRRHRGLRRIAEHTVGVMGRTPDYMNVTYAGFAGCAHEWAEHGNEDGAARQVEYQKFLRRNDICLTHTLIHPTIDKAKDEVPGQENDVILRKVCDTEHGIVVRGARILATLAPFADEIAVYPGRPLPEDGDKFAVSFCIPMATPGLKFVCRDSVAGTANRFDHPLSSRFDEQDAFVIFDDVEVPRSRVFIDANVKVYNQAMTRSWNPNVMQQTMVRASTKLEFAWGLATAMAEAIGDKSPTSQQTTRRTLELRGTCPISGSSGRGSPNRMGQRSLVPRRAAIVRASGRDAVLDAARQRDHQTAGLPQSAGNADLAHDEGPVAASVHRQVSARRQRHRCGTPHSSVPACVGLRGHCAGIAGGAVRAVLSDLRRAQPAKSAGPGQT